MRAENAFSQPSCVIDSRTVKALIHCFLVTVGDDAFDDFLILDPLRVPPSFLTEHGDY